MYRKVLLTRRRVALAARACVVSLEIDTRTIDIAPNGESHDDFLGNMKTHTAADQSATGDEEDLSYYAARGESSSKNRNLEDPRRNGDDAKVCGETRAGDNKQHYGQISNKTTRSMPRIKTLRSKKVGPIIPHGVALAMYIVRLT